MCPIRIQRGDQPSGDIVLLLRRPVQCEPAVGPAEVLLVDGASQRIAQAFMLVPIGVNAGDGFIAGAVSGA